MLALSVCGATSSAATAADARHDGRDPPGTLLDTYHFTEWSIRNGAPGEIISLAQTPDGYIWIVSNDGLFRFDGTRFVRFQDIAPPHEALLSPRVHAVTVGPQGELWIGYLFGGASVLSRGHLTHYRPGDGLPAHSTESFAIEPSGRVWAGTLSGLYLLQGDRFVPATVDWEARLGSVEKLALDKAGNVWALGENQLLVLKPGAHRFQAVALPRPTKPVAIDGFDFAPDGHPWLTISPVDFSAARYGPVPLPGEAWTPSLERQWRTERHVGGLCLIDPHGAIWLSAFSPWATPLAATADQTAKAADSTDKFPVMVNSCLVDREGSVWLGGSLGLRRYRKTPFTTIIANAEVARPFVLGPGASVLISRGDGWVDAYPGPRGEVPTLPKDRPLSQGIEAMAGSDGDLWEGGRGQLFHLANGRMTRVALPSDVAELPNSGDPSPVQCLAVDDRKTLWMSVIQRGTYQLADGRWTHVDGMNGLPAKAALVIHAGPGRQVWFGFPEDDLHVLDQTTGRYRSVQGLHVGAVQAIESGRHGTWVGGDIGVALVDEAGTHMLGVPGQTALGGVTGVVETPQGDLWLNGTAGLVRIDAKALTANLANLGQPLDAQVFDHLDGVATATGALRPTRTLLQTDDGRLWLRRANDIQTLQPDAVGSNPVVPPVFITGVEADGRAFAGTGRTELSGLVRNVRISFAVMSLAVPERVNARYRLDGQDASWRDAGTDRRAEYTNLPPGTYRFRVIGANDAGVWSQEAALDIVIPPAFWQTRWFVALCALALAALAWLAVRWYLHRVLAEEVARAEGRHTERTRIARELHDTLLQSSQGMIYQLQGIATEISRADPVRGQHMEEVLDRANDAVVEARERVRDLREGGCPPGTDLAAALKEELRLLAVRTTTKLSLKTNGRSRPLSADATADLIAIGREAVRNALAHAEASAIEIVVDYDRRGVTVEVHDDGLGVPQCVLEEGRRPGHWGLPGMRERADGLGAEFAIKSAPGQGTQVQAFLGWQRATIRLRPASLARKSELRKLEAT